MDDSEQLLKIPKERIAVLIGTKGQTKKNIEAKTKTRIYISKEEEITIRGESFDTWIAKQIIKAIGRGFTPEKSLLLLNDSNGFEIIDLKEWATSEKMMERVKGRVIGERGKSRETIEILTESYISVYGKTICIIGDIKKIMVAKIAIEMLLSGSMHATVFKMLESEKRKWRREELLE
jgi:ribosomal RNA assembly protein